MEREAIERLLAEYATGGLSAEDRKKLFTAAMEDQDLFDQLMEEDALRELIELPGARDQLIDALQEEMEPATVGRAAVYSMPAPAAPAAKSSMEQPAAEVAPPRRRMPIWYAWAAGLGVVFFSGVITYSILAPRTHFAVAHIPTPPTDFKPFTPPPAREASTAAPVVSAPEPLVAMAPKDTRQLPQADIPLPSAPPPPPARMEAADAAPGAAQAEEKLLAEVRKDAEPERQASSAEAEMGRARTPAAAGAPAVFRKTAPMGASAWRQTPGGEWVRLSEADRVANTDRVVIRYTPASNGMVALRDAADATLASRAGRTGVEMEFAVPNAALRRESGATITLTVQPAAGQAAKIVLRIR
jgi:hypothetical protein